MRSLSGSLGFPAADFVVHGVQKLGSRKKDRKIPVVFVRNLAGTAFVYRAQGPQNRLIGVRSQGHRRRNKRLLGDLLEMIEPPLENVDGQFPEGVLLFK